MESDVSYDSNTLIVGGVLRYKVSAEQLLSNLQLKELINLLRQGNDVLIGLGVDTVLLQREGGIIIGTPGDTGFHVSISPNSRPIIAEWLENVANLTPQSYLGMMPREIQKELLLHQNYEEILRACGATNLCNDEELWKRKAAQLGVTDAQWRRAKILPYSRRYLRHLTYRSKECYRGSEEFALPHTCAVRAAYMRRRDLVRYFMELDDFPIQLQKDLVIALAEVGFVDLYRNTTIYDPHAELYGAAKGGQMRVLESNEVYRNIYDRDALRAMISGAAAGGQAELLRQLLSRVDVTYDTLYYDGTSALTEAAKSGNKATFDLLLPYHPNLLEDVEEAAVLGGNEQIIDYVKSKLPAGEIALGLAKGYIKTKRNAEAMAQLENIATNSLPNEVLIGAAEAGNSEIVRYILDSNSEDEEYNVLLREVAVQYAASNNQISLVEEFFAPNISYNLILNRAIRKLSGEVLDLILSEPYIDLISAETLTFELGHLIEFGLEGGYISWTPDLVRLLVTAGAQLPREIPMLMRRYTLLAKVIPA